MYVVKRDGRQESVHFDKITSRLARLCYGLNPLYVDPILVSQKVCLGVYKGVTTSELDELAAETSAHLTSLHPDFGVLAARIAVSNLHKSTSKSFSQTCERLYHYIEPRTNKSAPILADDVFAFIVEHADRLNSVIVYDRDFGYDYFGFKTLQYSYLLKINGMIVERPQHMIMRVACGLHCGDVEATIETYNLMSQRWFTHATPTLFNAGTRCPQLSSCFLLSMMDDSIDGIYETLKSCALISKQAGGIGIAISNIRAAGSYIRGTNGTSNGLVPMLRVYNATARYVDQCLTPETIVYTRTGPKKICEVTTSDYLLSSTGEYRQVQKLLRHEYKGDILSMQVKHALAPVKVTGEHQVLALRCQEIGLKYSVLRNRLDKGYVAPSMCNAGDLQVGDFVCWPVPQLSTVTDIEALSEHDLRFYGIIVGGGWVGAPGTHSNSGISLEVIDKNVEVIHFVRWYCELNGIRLTDNERVDSPNIRLLWDTNSIGFKFHRSQVYNGENNKIIDPAFFNLPSYKLTAIIKGVFEANSHDVKKECMLEMSSPAVIYGVRYMLIKCGVLTSGYTRGCSMVSDCEAITIGKATGALRIPRTKITACIFPTETNDKWVTFLLHNNMLYSRIEKIQIEQYEGVVHDFEVEGEHTYVTDGLGTVHNGGGKRKGAFAVYLEPWHVDIVPFLEMKKNHGAEEERARDLFYGLWVCDLFMKRVESNGPWSLFCPNEAPGLQDAFGDDFDALYEKYESIPGKPRKVIRARELWQQILESQQETGTPYMLYKDAANRKSNQKNLGTIRCSNLCTEILEYTSPEEIAVCNLASIALPMFVNKSHATNSSPSDSSNGSNSTQAQPTFDFGHLCHVTQVVCRNLNKIIDINYYPVPQAERSNLRNRPIGIGVQGLADMFIAMRMPFDSPQAQQLNRDIFETIYFGALTASCELARIHGHYESYQGSPISQGELSFDMWGVQPSRSSLDWAGLRRKIALYGVRNSLLCAPMPTASTSQILGNNECLVGSTLVSLSSGLSVRISNMPNGGANVNSFNGVGLINQIQYELLHRGIRDVVKLTMFDGCTITCTPSHRFMLTDGSYVEAQHLTTEHRIVFGISGTEDVVGADEAGYMINLGLGIWSMDTHRDSILSYTRILGFIRANGSVQPDKVTAVFGLRHDADSFKGECVKLSPTSKVTDRVNARGCIEVIITGALAIAIRTLVGVTIGSRVQQPFEVAHYVNTAPIAVLREYLAGLFGGDGVVPTLVETQGQITTFAPVRFLQTACLVHLESLITGMQHVIQMLGKFGFAAGVTKTSYVTKVDGQNYRCGCSKHVRITISLSMNALTAWRYMELIGIRYSGLKLVRYGLAALWSKYIHRIAMQYNAVMLETSMGIENREDSKGAAEPSLLNAIGALEAVEPILNDHYGRPTVTQYYDYIKRGKSDLKEVKFKFVMSAEQFLERIGARLLLNEPGENKTVHGMVLNNMALPIFSTHMIDRRATGTAEVYDINVTETHNFVANGLVVHNCFEPVTSNIYVRRTLAGEFVCVSRPLLHDLIDLGIWSPELKNKLIANNGSVQNISEIPADIRALYRTVWEIPQRALIDMAADRGAYIDQSQSLNIHMANCNAGKLTSMHFYAWRKGLKTGMYYLRTKPATDALKFTIEPAMIQQEQKLANTHQAVNAKARQSAGRRENENIAKESQNGSQAVTISPKNVLFADINDAETARLLREQNLAAMECSLSNPDSCLMCGS